MRAASIVIALAAACVACEPPVLVSPDIIAPREDATRGEVLEDTAPSDAATPRASLGEPCEPRTEGACAEGLSCDARINRCVACLIVEQRCGADGAREICRPGTAGASGPMVGGTFVANPCAPREACVARTATTASCEPIVCEAGFATCDSAGRRRYCDPTGTVETVETCTAGSACYGGDCQPVRHNVLLIFDTSGSMHDYADPALSGSPINCEQSGTPCMPTFPACDVAAPMTLFSLSKQVFSQVIADSIGGYSQFALQRFPQRESGLNTANCWLGWYLPLEGNRMTGDDDAMDTTAGRWFSDNLSDVLLVPFPPRNTLDNTETLLAWMDFSERLGATEQPCVNHADCGTGRCGELNDERRCFRHTDHELRAGGETPLGKSLFYAGEYFRRYVRVDGKPCTTDASCGSAGYMCTDGVCADPYRDCKDDFIILFTDGEETTYGDETAFFNPAVQARRLAFGLACEGDADCHGGARCESGHCVPPGADVVLPPPYRPTSETERALTNPWGVAVSVRTTVITLNARATRNARIAASGGGANLEVQAADPEAFRLHLRAATAPNFKCEAAEPRRR